MKFYVAFLSLASVAIVDCAPLRSTAARKTTIACEGHISAYGTCRDSPQGSAFEMINSEVEQIWYGRHALLDERLQLTEMGTRVAHDIGAMLPFVDAIQESSSCPPEAFKGNDFSEVPCDINTGNGSGSNGVYCCDNTGDLNEILCTADLITICNDADYCVLIPGSGSQGPVCVCNN